MFFSKCIWFVLLIGIISCSNLKAANTPPLLPVDFTNLTKQDRALIRDLKLITYPPKEWKIDAQISNNDDICYDVVIVGGGMAGLSTGAALFKEGIYNIKIFDQNSPGCEGPWMSIARMRTLQSSKDLTGPALDIPHLTFHAWFEAQWGAEAWKELGKIPNSLWMDYLSWYGKAMQLPIENHWTLVSILPGQECFELEFEQPGGKQIVNARKVVLATGRGGFGGMIFPSFIKDLPRSTYAHTSEIINFEALKGHRIAVIGVGSSGFDAAAVALETGTKSVDLIMRRARIPNVNKFGSLYYKSFVHGYYHLSNEKRWEFMAACFEPGLPPPVEALQRLQKQENFHLRPNTTIDKVSFEGKQVLLETNHGQLTYDFLILGTGFNIDGTQQPELRAVIDDIALWEEQVPSEMVKSNPNFGKFPYLGPSFEFQPKNEGTASYLKNLYCFNYGATMSHALVSSDIPGISIGAKRLAEGIAADFFIQDSELYLKQLKEYSVPNFDQDLFFRE